MLSSYVEEHEDDFYPLHASRIGFEKLKQKKGKLRSDEPTKKKCYSFFSTGTSIQHFLPFLRKSRLLTRRVNLNMNR